MRSAGPEEWRLLRDLRLGALRDAPEAFGSTLGREVSFSDEQWGRWLARLRWFVAELEGHPMGLVAAGPIEGRPGRCEVHSLWVDPGARRRGAGAALIGAVGEWASGRGAEALLVGVADGNEGARRFYEDLGFTPNGHRQPLRSDPSRCTSGYTLAI